MSVKLIELAKSKAQQRRELRANIGAYKKSAREQEGISMFHARQAKEMWLNISRMERQLTRLKP